MCKLSLRLVPSVIAFFLPILPFSLYSILQIIRGGKIRNFRGSISNRKTFPVK